MELRDLGAFEDRGALKASCVREKLVSWAESKGQGGDKEGTELCTTELRGMRAGDEAARLPKAVGNCGRD